MMMYTCLLNELYNYRVIQTQLLAGSKSPRSQTVFPVTPASTWNQSCSLHEKQVKKSP